MTEYGGKIHNHRAYLGPLPGCGETPMGRGDEAVVVTAGAANSRNMGGGGKSREGT